MKEDTPSSGAPPLPREIQLEVTGACNLRCHMCLVRYRPPLDRRTASMPFATFRRIVDALPGVERITLQGLGEPLLAPDLPRMIAYAAARGIRAGFNTNATLLSRPIAERLLSAGVGWIHVSVDGTTAATYEGIRDGGRFAAVQRNIAGLVELARARADGGPELGLVFVAMRRNVKELPALVRLAAALGMPSVRVQNLSHSFDDTPAGPGYDAIRGFTEAEALWVGRGDEVAAIFDEARNVAATLDVALRLPEVEERRHLRPAGTPGCDWPWRSAYVRHDGGVQPCCMLMGEDRAILGDVRATAFPEVWSGPAYVAFRAALLGDRPPDVCRGCSMYRGVF
jgi:radical SAM protein with 4Fe4S-binding SPASM domain